MRFVTEYESRHNLNTANLPRSPSQAFGDYTGTNSQCECGFECDSSSRSAPCAYCAIWIAANFPRVVSEVRGTARFGMILFNLKCYTLAAENQCECEFECDSS